jgi:hypothetical protein
LVLSAVKPRARLCPRRLEVVEAAHRRGVDHLAVEQRGRPRADDAAARPIDRDALAHGTAQKLDHRHAQRLALDIEAGVEDRPHSVAGKPARDGADMGIKRCIDAADRAGVLADQAPAEATDQRREPPPPALLELRPAAKALVRADLEKGIGVPAAIGMEVLELGDFHAALVD